MTYVSYPVRECLPYPDCIKGLHGVWDTQSRFLGSNIAPYTNLTEIDLGLDLLWRAGVQADKVVLGLGWVCHSLKPL